MATKSAINNLYFEQYKMLVNSAERVCEKRMASNNFFITINTGLLSLFAYLSSTGIIATQSTLFRVIGLLGIAISIIWFLIILSYKQLNTGKYTLIHKIEEKLPLKLYKDEWEILGSGKNLIKYVPLSHVEILVPCVFLIFYLIFIFAKA